MSSNMSRESNEKMLQTQKTDTIRVLHLDDDPGLLLIAKELLEMNGELEVHNALSVEDALKMISQEEYDVIVYN